MINDIELEEIKKRDENTLQTPEPVQDSDPENDQSVSIWAYASAALLLVVAIPMVVFPRFLLFMSESSSERRNALTPLESFLSINGGILLATLSLSLLFNIPSNPLFHPRQSQGAPNHPLLIPLTTACNLIAFISYNTRAVSSLAFIVFLGSLTIGTWGLWAILFAGSSYRSRKTGADKRTSRFLFGNKAAASSQKKDWKRKQAQRSW